MLLNKGPIPNSMGLNPQSTAQFGQTAKNTLTSPSTWAKGLRRIGLPLSLLLQTNEAHAAELPGFQDKLQQQGLLTMPHEQQHSQPNTMQHEQQQAIQPLQNVNTMPHEEQMRDARQSLGSSFTEQEVMRPPFQGALMSRESWTRGDEGGDEGANDGRPYFTEPSNGPSNDTSADTSSGSSRTYRPNSKDKTYKLRDKNTGEIIKIKGPKGANKEQIVEIYEYLLNKQRQP